MHFLDPPSVRYNRGKFHHCRIGVADFTEEGGGGPLSSPEKAHPE